MDDRLAGGGRAPRGGPVARKRLDVILAEAQARARDVFGADIDLFAAAVAASQRRCRRDLDPPTLGSVR